MDIQSLYTHNQPREYRAAFDLVASSLTSRVGKSLCILSSDIYAVELIKRCPNELDLIGTDGFDAAGFIQSAADLCWGRVNFVSIDRNTSKYETILWVEPNPSQLKVLSQKLRHVSIIETRLFVVVPGVLHRFILDVELPARNNRNLVQIYSLLRCLNNNGWQIDCTIGLHGPRSLLWSGIFRLCILFGRHDLADKFLFTLRNSYQESGCFWWLSPLTIICAAAI